MSLLILRNARAYVECDDRPWIRAFFISAHSEKDPPTSYARIDRDEAIRLRDKLNTFIEATK